MQTIEQLQLEIEEIKKRNQRVEADKAWETSWARKIIIFLLTYTVIVIFFFFAQLPNPFLNAIVPSLAFVLSTLTVPMFKKWWLKKQAKQIMHNNKNKLFLQITSGAFFSIIFTIFGYFLSGFIAFYVHKYYTHNYIFTPYQFYFFIFPLTVFIAIIAGNVIGVITGKHNFQKPKKVIAIFSIGSLLILLGFLFLWWWA